jgi:hypothetical protein
MVFGDLASKPVVTVSSGLTSKPTATIFSSLASKLVAMVSFGLTSKSVVGFLVEPQNQGGGGFSGLAPIHPLWSPSPVLQLVLELIWSPVDSNRLCGLKATWRKVLLSLWSSMVRISVTGKIELATMF